MKRLYALWTWSRATRMNFKSNVYISNVKSVVPVFTPSCGDFWRRQMIFWLLTLASTSKCILHAHLCAFSPLCSFRFKFLSKIDFDWKNQPKCETSRKQFELKGNISNAISVWSVWRLALNKIPSMPSMVLPAFYTLNCCCLFFRWQAIFCY